MIGDGGQSGFDVATRSSGSTRSSTPRPRSTSTTATSPTGSGPPTRSSGRPARSSTRRSSATRWCQRHDVRRHRPHGRTGRRRFGLGDRDDRRGQQRSATPGPAPSRRSCGDWESSARPALDRRGVAATGPAARSRRSSGRRPTRRPPGPRPPPAGVFITTNVDAEPAAAVDLDPARRRRDHARTGSSAASTSTRPTPNRAWVSYSGLQREHAGDAGARLRGDVRPGDRHVDLGRPVVRPRRPAGHRPRPRRRDRATSTPRPTSACCGWPAARPTWTSGGPGHAERRGRRPDRSSRASGSCTRPRTA